MLPVACAAALVGAALVAPPLTPPSPAAVTGALLQLERAVHAGGGHTPLVDACLAVCRALPGERGAAALPADARELGEATAFFDWEEGDTLCPLPIVGGWKAAWVCCAFFAQTHTRAARCLCETQRPSSD